jgi:SH3-like domain-containing protein
MRRTILFLMLLSSPVVAAPEKPASQRPAISPEGLKHNSGLPVPRFASLRAEKAHLRAGPGKDYPARATFIRPGVPLEVLHEWSFWRQVRDADGLIGWMDRAMLSTERTFQVTGSVRTLHARPDISSPPVWRAEPGVVGRIVTCAERWCRIEVEGRGGWILREHGFGVYPEEQVEN